MYILSIVITEPIHKRGARSFYGKNLLLKGDGNSYSRIYKIIVIEYSEEKVSSIS